MHPLETYLEELGAHRGVATKETSGYCALILLQPELDKNYQVVKVATIPL